MIRWALLGVGLTFGGLGIAAVPDVTARPEPARRAAKADRLDLTVRQPIGRVEEPVRYATAGSVTQGFDRLGRLVFEVNRDVGITILAKGTVPRADEHAAGAGRLPAF